MLKNIHIRNFALAQQLDLEFENGLNIITGETGTGKSILVGAISAVLGGRVFTEVVRTGADKAFIEATFYIANLPNVKELLEEKGLDSGDDLFLRREISTKGSTRAFVNDIPVTITALSEIGDQLVDIHSQNEHQSLLRKETHQYFLDSFSQLENHLKEVKEKYHQVKNAENKLQELKTKQNALDEKYELYQFQLNEIEKVQIKIGEDEELESERKILANTEQLYSLSDEFSQITGRSENANLQELMGQSLHILQKLSEFSDELHNIYKEFSSAKIIIEEATRSVEEFQNTLEYNPARLEEIEQRLSTIYSLKKKYGSSIAEILNYRDKIKSELQLKENFEFELKKLEKEFEDALEKYTQSALKLSENRKKAAKNLEKEVIMLLAEIGMPKTRFQVNFEWIEDSKGIFKFEDKLFYGDETGVDQIEFYISPNPGEEFKPLTKIASGGEISRIMLALKNILAEIDRIPLLIFDEIDAGVSGEIALAVGKSIQELSNSHQIMTITHLPQIASFGKAHYRVEKYIDNSRTFTKVVYLNDDERVKEIAKLMGGKEMSDSILQSAKQLLNEASEGVQNT